MYGDPISRDLNSLLHSSTFKHPAHGEFAKIKQLISLDPNPNYYDYHSQNQNQNQQDENSGQNQSSFFLNLLNENGDDEFPDLPPSSPAAMNGLRRVPSLSPSNDNNYGYTNPSDLDCASSFRVMDSNLVRQNSTPAGFLSTLNGDNGFSTMKKAIPSTTLNSHISFPPGPSSSPSRFLHQTAKNENDLHDSKFNSLKRNRDGVLKMPLNGETRNHTSNLVHHMSLPKTSSEMAVVDNILQFHQESTVPWKTRAKRGFATHPRSIAERVRRTRISERIKRLQDLFPDIDKHSNTADMLDIAVEYIKNLQKELQTLKDARARCRCPSKQLRSE